MPSVSQRQHDFMLAVSKNPKLAEKYGIDIKVAKEFVEADKELGLYETHEGLHIDEFVDLEDDHWSLIPSTVDSKKIPIYQKRFNDRFCRIGVDEEESE